MTLLICVFYSFSCLPSPVKYVRFYKVREINEEFYVTENPYVTFEKSYEFSWHLGHNNVLS